MSAAFLLSVVKVLFVKKKVLSSVLCFDLCHRSKFAKGVDVYLQPSGMNGRERCMRDAIVLAVVDAVRVTYTS